MLTGQRIDLGICEAGKQGIALTPSSVIGGAFHPDGEFVIAASVVNADTRTVRLQRDNLVNVNNVFDRHVPPKVCDPLERLVSQARVAGSLNHVPFFELTGEAQ